MCLCMCVCRAGNKNQKVICLFWSLLKNCESLYKLISSDSQFVHTVALFTSPEAKVIHSEPKIMRISWPK